MQQPTATYDKAAEQIAAYVQPLWPGNLALPFELHDEQGRKLALTDDHLSGRFALLVFVDPKHTLVEHSLQRLADFQGALIERKIATIVVSASANATDNRALKRRVGLEASVVGDSTGATFASYGLHKGKCDPFRIVLLTPYRQVRIWYDSPENMDETIAQIMSIVDAAPAAQPDQWQPSHAPVLMVPNVLSAEECGRLIEAVETGGPLTVRPPRQGEFAGDYKIPVYDHHRQDRVDHIIKDPNISSFLDSRIWERVVPMIKKSFSFEVTRREDLHIARYEGERSGNLMGHRDNVSASTAYRRFALSVNLNDNYEGGQVVFREFSQLGYKSPPGTALVFSSSLLHEILETTNGVRYSLISHLFSQ